MKKNGEFVGVDEKFIPEDEKYVDESLVGDKEKTKKVAKRIGIAQLVMMFIPFIIFIIMAIFMVTQFNKVGNNYEDTIKGNKYSFSHLQGTQSTFRLTDYLDDIITNNKLDAYTTITVVYNEKSAVTEEEILSLKQEISNAGSKKYEVSVDYADSRGQVINKVTIKDI